MYILARYLCYLISFLSNIIINTIIVIIRIKLRARDTRLDIHACSFWERKSSDFFGVRVCYQNAKSYRGLTTEQIYQQHESEKRRVHPSRVLEVQQGSFTAMVLTTTGGMAVECKRYYSILTEL